MLGYQSIRLAQYAGIVSLGDRVLEILPKVEVGDGIPEVGRGIFLRLLHLSGNTKLFTDSQVHQDLRRQTLLDVFIASYFDEVAALVRAGLLRRYKTLEADLPLVRGRLLIGRQAATHAMRVDQLACRFDELTADHIWNQALKAAIDLARPWITGIELGRRCMALSGALADVSKLNVAPTDIDALVFDRQATRYKAALQWAKWILRILSPNLRAGRNEAPGLIFDMNRLFESAVVAVLRRRAAANAGPEICAQEADLFLTTLQGTEHDRVYGLRPDIVVRQRGAVLAVADTKWSRLSVRSDGHLLPEGSHVYQMQAYASVYPCEKFTLVYPWHSGLRGSRPTSFQLPPIGTRKPVLNIICVDVGSDAFESFGRAGDGADVMASLLNTSGPETVQDDSPTGLRRERYGNHYGEAV